MKFLSALFFLLVLFSCKQTKYGNRIEQVPIVDDNQDIILSERDLIPEGVAYDSVYNEIYVGSIYKQKVISIDEKGKVRDVITKKQFGPLSPLGITIDNDKGIVWACANTAPLVNFSNTNYWEASVLAFNLENGNTLSKFKLKEASKGMFFNDLTVTENGTVFITESSNSNIYKIDSETSKLELYVDLKGYTFPNGIVYYKPLSSLFIATNQGILKIDIQTKNIDLLKAATNNAKGIDGLALYDNYFIGHQSSKVSKFYVDDAFTEITKVEVLDSGEEFDSSTTGEIGNGFYHFIVNSQLQSGINRTGENPKIKPLDSLENIIIRKIKL